MPREKRVWLKDRFYHIICRGNRRDPLFRSASDFEAFIQILNQLHQRYYFEIASYCFMTNHYHLQIRSPEIPFSKLMGLINKRYADYYNTKYRLTGHVFEKRYYDKLIDTKEGMLEVSRYIHRNPTEARMARKPHYYPWSSYPSYKYPRAAYPFLMVNLILRYYEGTEMEKREKYCKSVEEEQCRSALPDGHF